MSSRCVHLGQHADGEAGLHADLGEGEGRERRRVGGKDGGRAGERAGRRVGRGDGGRKDLWRDGENKKG